MGTVSKLHTIDYSHTWALSSMRRCANDHEKAILAHQVYKIPNRVIGKKLGIDEASVRRALKAHSEGRPLGQNGRPRTFSPEEEAEIEQWLLEETDMGTSLRPCEIMDLVCHSCVLSRAQ